MRSVCPLGRGAAGVHAEHRRGPPARQHHQVAFLPASGEEPVRERVPQRMRVKVGNAGLLAERLESPPDPVRGDRSAFGEQEGVRYAQDAARRG
jgi:hypothetical protein